MLLMFFLCVHAYVFNNVTCEKGKCALLSSYPSVGTKCVCLCVCACACACVRARVRVCVYQTHIPAILRLSGVPLSSPLIGHLVNQRERVRRVITRQGHCMYVCVCVCVCVRLCVCVSF